MNVEQMHIDVKTQIQRLASHRNRKLQPQEIDWFLNMTQDSMVSNAVIPGQAGNPRFQVDRGKREIIAGLIVSNKELLAWWDGITYLSRLPANVWYLLDDASKLVQLCNGDTKTTVNIVETITTVPFELSKAQADYYKSVELIYNNVPLITLSDELIKNQIVWEGLSGSEEHFYIRDLLLQKLWEKNVNVYWEKYGDIYEPYSFLFVSESTPVPIVLKVDGEQHDGVNQERTREVHRSSKKTIQSPNTMISPDTVFGSNATPYFKTSYISPLSELGPGQIKTHSDNSYIVCNTVVNFVRKPRPISIILGTDCSLSETVHQELCNRTVETILNRIESPAWKEQTEKNIIAKTQA